MRPAEIDALLKDGIALAQAGQRFEARRALQDVLDVDPDRALAWMWLATITEDRATRIEYLERALTLDPTDETARQAYTQLTGENFIPPPPSTGASADTPARRVRPKRSAILVAGIVLVIAVLAFAFVLLLDAGDQPVRHSGPISSATINALLTPQPTSTPLPRVSLIPTITRTPLPTPTSGPSPTSIWDAPPPTWTSPPTLSASATWTQAPSSTANPSPIPFVAPAVRTATAAFAHTSDAPLDVRQSATAQIEHTYAAATASPTPTSTASVTVDSLRATVNARFTQAAATSETIQTEIAATQTAAAQ
jgi:hypothetical protein